ncbi:Ig-like domain-containing protein [Lachnoclostridium phytofermentans]|uniref:Metallophosphoesterase n=1 Tax=Lachnoclostridium phytofermentans (strain ATCC 700394 / DSM 18823 / ISDg) TaxID=357809 RepID=A9KHU0_LACP7|nr:Ig-like domain-containing protein [Lachnoclostridium phytofermentans]ABX43787.1 metallophosphoesterase [Lachnoclostridium phytofermentans ISDg]
MAYKKMKKYLKKTITALLAVAMTAGCLAAGVPGKQVLAATTSGTSATSKDNADTKTNEKDKLNFRFILTTDLHGTVSSVDYIGGTNFPNTGLSRAYQLIEKAREEVGKANAVTLDAGDVLFDASMEYIMDQDSDVVQPIYQAMALVGYDAITLGNHDFDYGKDYLLQQLAGSGLMDKVVVSNLKNSKENSYPFLQNMIITRDAVTASGKKVTINIGIVGETIPTLSTKTDDYTGIWKTEDIVENVRKESKLLKEQGADIVVALVHSGFGEEEPESMATNAAYALTKIDEVDVILCGHEHNAFPNPKSDNSSYNSMPGVDPVNGIVNGKVMVMAMNLARSIGIADLTLEYDQTADKFEIVSQKGSNRLVSDYKTTENKAIVDTLSEWKEEMEGYRSHVVATLKDGVTIHNFFSLLEDSNALQLQNDARIAYARRYIERFDKTYANYPVIAAASNYSFGANSSDDYVNISGQVKQSDLFTLQSYRQYTCIYKVTGAQLREWMEWCAGMYNTMDSNDMVYLISDEWQDNWANYFVFDGIQYTIDPYVKPRYNIDGIKINSTRRITNLTYNGQLVTDDMEFIIASNSLSSLAKTNPVFQWANTQMIRNLYRTQVLITEFLQNEIKTGGYEPVPDYNWKLALNKNQEFIIKVPKMASDLAVKSDWYKETLIEGDEYNYYCGKLSNEPKVKEPYIVVAPGILDPVAEGYDIYVDAFSSFGIKSIKYMYGNLKIDAGEWVIARNVEKHKFSVPGNSNISILVEDNNGNKKLYTLVIDNIGVKEMAPPKVWSFSNKKSSITGRTEANVTVVIETQDGKIYEGRSTRDGSYSVSIPSQKAGSLLYVYAKDVPNDRQSNKVKVKVKRSGPDQLSVVKYFNNSDALTGKTNEEDALVIAVVDTIRRVYIPKDGGENRLAQCTEIDLDNFSVIEVDETVDEKGNFSIQLPNIDVGYTIKLYNIDHVGRVSKVATTSILEGGPYSPEVEEITNMDNEIYGNVKSVTGEKQIEVTIVAGGSVYKTKTDTSGYFSMVLNNTLNVGDEVTVYAEDFINGSKRISRQTKLLVSDMKEQQETKNVSIADIEYNVTTIKVTYLPSRDISLAIPTAEGIKVINGTTNSTGIFNYKVTDNLVQGGYVYAYHRNNLGNLIALTTKIVKYEKPKSPILLTEITNTHKNLKIVTEQNNSVIATIGNKVYESKSGVYNKKYKGYVHTVAIEKVNSGTKIIIHALNETTMSDPLEIKVVKLAPDMPIVKPITTGQMTIEGSVDVFLSGNEGEATIKNSKTKVYAKIDNINYTGVISDDGTFTIKVPKLKSGSLIKIYASNKNGYGPIKTIILP